MLTSGYGAFLVYSLISPLILVGVIALAITVVAGGKEPDPAGTRVRAVYLGAVCFTALFLTLGSLFAFTASLADLIGEADTQGFRAGSVGDDGEPQFADEGGRTEEAVSGAVLAGLVGLASAAVFEFHRRRMESLIGEPGFVNTPARRSVQAYHYAVSFVAAFLALGAAAVAAYAVYRIALPDYSNPLGDNERTAGARQLVSAAVLGAAAVLVFLRHLERPEGWEREAAGIGHGGGPTPAPSPTSVPAPEPIDLTPEPSPPPSARPRRRRPGSDNEGGPIA